VDDILARAGIFHPVEPDVASALTIRMHKVVFPRLTHFSPRATRARVIVPRAGRPRPQDPGTDVGRPAGRVGDAAGSHFNDSCGQDAIRLVAAVSSERVADQLVNPG
jgi:hypothetical protein